MTFFQALCAEGSEADVVAGMIDSLEAIRTQLGKKDVKNPYIDLRSLD